MGAGEIMGYVELFHAIELDTCDLCSKKQPKVEGKSVITDHNELLWICGKCSVALYG
jgi:ribosomal protein S27AE